MESLLGTRVPRALTARQKEAERKRRWKEAMRFANAMANGAFRRPEAKSCEMHHIGPTGRSESCLWRCGNCGELSFGYGDGTPLEECPVCHAKVKNKLAQLTVLEQVNGNTIQEKKAM